MGHMSKLMFSLNFWTLERLIKQTLLGKLWYSLWYHCQILIFVSLHMKFLFCKVQELTPSTDIDIYFLMEKKIIFVTLTVPLPCELCLFITLNSLWSRHESGFTSLMGALEQPPHSYGWSLALEESLSFYLLSFRQPLNIFSFSTPVCSVSYYLLYHCMPLTECWNQFNPVFYMVLHQVLPHCLPQH